MKLDKIIYNKKDQIAWIILNDPSIRNPITGPMADELEYCINDCADDPEVRAVVIQGMGKSFSAGGNLQIMKQRIDAGNSNNRSSIRKLAAIFNRIREMGKPVIASIQGSAAGAGLSLALACDFRIVTQDCKFTMAFINIGFIADMCSVHSLLKAIGVPRTSDLLFTGRLFSAEEAYQWGLVNQLVASAEQEKATQEFATRMANGPTIAYQYLKKMINQIAYQDVQITMSNELEYQFLCSKTADHKEGVFAFLEKRQPIFTGK